MQFTTRYVGNAQRERERERERETCLVDNIATHARNEDKAGTAPLRLDDSRRGLRRDERANEVHVDGAPGRVEVKADGVADEAYARTVYQAADGVAGSRGRVLKGGRDALVVCDVAVAVDDGAANLCGERLQLG